MSTEVPEGQEPQRGASPRPPRVGDSRSPVGSTLSIVLAVLAVVAGFLIIRELTDDDDADTTSPGTDTGESIPNLSLPTGGTTVTGETGGAGVTTTSPSAAATRSGATIAVANASGIGGSAAAMSSALTVEGYEGVGEPGNGTGEQLTASVVYYVPNDPAAQAVGQTLASDLGGVSLQPMPATRPADGGDTATATVLVMLGSDAAEKSLSELRATAVSAPAVAGGSTPGTTSGDD
jgi:hypothetical protein